MNLLRFNISFIIALSITLIIGTFSNAMDLKYPFESDWSKVDDFNFNKNELDFQNAYWLAALSDYSYWDYKILVPFYTAKKNTLTTVSFKSINPEKSDKTTTEIIQKQMRGYGFTNVKFFSSSLTLKPENYKNSNKFLIQKWPSPLPIEACLLPNKYFCFARIVNGYNPASSSKISSQELRDCGEHFEKALYTPEDLKLLSTQQKNKISEVVHQYEAVHKTVVGLDFDDEQFIYRCEAFKQLSVDDPDTQFAWLENDDFVAIVFRGTEIDNPADRATAFETKSVQLLTLPLNSLLNVAKINLKNIKIHQGFLNALDVTRETLFSEFSKFLDIQQKSGKPPKPVFLAGHSLGGALSQVLTYYILDYNRKINAVDLPRFGINIKASYSFGAPRVGNASWVDEFDNLAQKAHVGNYRFINNKDPIPHSPCGDFKHAGTTVYLDPHTDLEHYNVNDPFAFVEAIINPSVSVFDDSTCALSHDLLGNIFNFKSHLKDHYMTSYFDALTNVTNANVKKSSNQIH